MASLLCDYLNHLQSVKESKTYVYFYNSFDLCPAKKTTSETFNLKRNVFQASKALNPLGLGSTGRTVASNLAEQLAMQEFRSNPAMGRIVKSGLKDPRWPEWVKMSWRNGEVEIHYVGKWDNGKLIYVDDFKFKDIR